MAVYELTDKQRDLIVSELGREWGRLDAARPQVFSEDGPAAEGRLIDRMEEITVIQRILFGAA